MGVSARRTRIAVLLLGLWALAPFASAGPVVDATQCDAYLCLVQPEPPWDCPAEAPPRCILKPELRVSCAGGTCLPGSAAGKCLVRVSDCWYGELVPADPREDHADAYRTHALPAGSHHFVLAQPDVATEPFRLCVRPPGGATVSALVGPDGVALLTVSGPAGEWGVGVGLQRATCGGTIAPAAADAPAAGSSALALIFPGLALAKGKVCCPACQGTLEGDYVVGMK